MTEIEQAYREGYHDCEFRRVNEDQGWSASNARATQEKLAAQRKIVRESSEKLKEQFRNGGA